MKKNPGLPAIRRSLIVLLILGLGLTIQPALAADTQKIVIYGASGNIGSVIVTEALDRGHHVIGVSRTPEKFSIDHSNFTAVAGDVTDAASVLQTVTGVDVVVVSVHGNGPANKPENTVHNRAAVTLIDVCRTLGESAPRIMQVGGATTLHPTRTAMAENLPFEAPEGSLAHGVLFGHWHALENYRAAEDIGWTVITPSMMIGPGERTGAFRLGTDTLIRDDSGNSSISREDFAMAIVDEIEQPHFVGKRFTVGY